MRVALSAIAFDAGTQVRAAINEQVVTDYAERMTDGVVFPPIVLFHDGNSHYLGDGFHRFMAAQRNAFRDIEADVRAGTKEDALWFALGANNTNGQRLNDVDKRHAIKLALTMFPDKSQNQIADQIGCSQRYVSSVKDQVRTTSNLPDRVIGKDGKSYPSSKPRTLESTRPDRSPSAVTQRRKDIRDMAERGFTTRQIAAGLEIHEETVGEIAKKEGICIHADRVVGKTRRHDSNRIVERMVMDAENLCADVNLIEFGDLGHEQIASWLKSLQDSRDALNAFIRRLMKEQQKHVEVA